MEVQLAARPARTEKIGLAGQPYDVRLIKNIMDNKFFKTILIPIVLVIANVNAQFLYGLLPSPAGEVTFNMVRVSLYFWAGMRITSLGTGNVRQAGKAGAVLLFIDHVVLRGGLFLFGTLLGNVTVKFGLMSFGGVLVSYLLFAGVAFLIGALGGYWGRRFYQGEHAPT